MSDQEPDSKWHLDKKVPIAIIVALVVQTLTIVAVASYWKASVDGRLDNLERTDTTRNTHENRITVLEQKFDFIRDGIAEIKQAIRENGKKP